AKSADGGMRDGLSILDQVLSFGEGPVTAQRVRDVLGLIPEDMYGELLRLVADRDTHAVFPLVERLVDAGADLGEFVAGAGEALRPSPFPLPRPFPRRRVPSRWTACARCGLGLLTTRAQRARCSERCSRPRRSRRSKGTRSRSGYSTPIRCTSRASSGSAMRSR